MGINPKHILTILTIFVCSILYGQTTPQVHKINGKKYYLHVVEPGNTLYGISRLYEVSIDQIQTSNPESLKEGLKVNQTLLILVTSDNKKDLAPVEQNGDFLDYTVQPSDTPYAIAQRYNVKMELILESNPSIVTDGLKAGSVIQIPLELAEVQPIQKMEAQPDSLKGHVVRKGETLYAIKTAFNVEIDALVAANPGIELNLREGSLVRIPGTSIRKPKKLIDSSAIDSILVHIPDSGGTYNIGLLLPFIPTFPDSSNAHDFKINSVSRIALSYFRGFKFAIDSLDSLYSVQFNLKVYSVMNDSASLKSALNDAEFESLDIVVGPFYTSQFERVADRMLQKGVLVICPVNKPSKILFKRPNAIKMLPSESMQISSLAEFLATDGNDSTLVLVNSNKFQDTQNIDFFKERFAATLNIPDTFADDVIKEIKLWDVNRETLKMRFTDTGDYVLVVPSKDQVFVTKLLNGLYDFALDSKDSYRFQVYGISEWTKWDEGLDLRQMQLLKVTLPLPNHVDFNDSIVNRFYQHYYSENGFEPIDYTLQGFDLCHYLYEELASNPSQWFKSPHEYNAKGVLNDIQFKRVLDDSGIENQYVRFFQYHNFTLKKIGEWPLTKNK
jgi:LysM repeat protein